MDVVGRKVVKTRAAHVCFGCRRKFERGTMMERSCVFDGKPWTCYLCESCQEASSELNWGDEYGFGDLRERSLEIESAKMDGGADADAEKALGGGYLEEGGAAG